MEGLIISNISNLYQVKVENKVIECSVRGRIKQTDLSPVVGDNVEIELLDNEDKGIINDIIDRKTYCKRPKIANLSQIILVVSLKNPKPDLLLLDKQLAYSEYLNIKPIICINKIDVGDREVLKKIHSIYEKIGYKVIETAAKENIGVEEIKKILKGNITAFSGNSGVGKSTLINKLLNRDEAKEGEISVKNKKGKNTTTSSFLYEIDEGYIADTPGFSTFSIEEIESKDLAHYFIEFTDYISECEYGDCSHIKENNCGIKDALNNGKINIERYENYCKICEELKDKEERKW
ncbi:MAG: ribosome small subunit-dependent GTPase A [Clostridia bacterium]|nr:ribosome small subunit-dependent GTPase A [Clostridia bacterium]